METIFFGLIIGFMFLLAFVVMYMAYLDYRDNLKKWVAVMFMPALMMLFATYLLIISCDKQETEQQNRQPIPSVDHQCCPCVEQDASSLDLWQDIWVVF